MLALVDLLVDVPGELGKRIDEAFAPIGAVAQRELALHQLLRHPRDLIGVLGGESEQVHGHAVRERHGERGDEVGAGRTRERIEQGVGRGRA